MLAEKSFDPFVILLPCPIHYGNTCKLEATEYECAAYIYTYILMILLATEYKIKLAIQF